MEETIYVHKTTKEQFGQFRRGSKNTGELLWKVFMNETGRGVAYQTFLSNLATWLRTKHGVTTSVGVQKINERLTKKFA